jgi:hypothetical protein
VKAAAFGEVLEGSACGNPRALMAAQAKGLLLVTARAARAVLARSDRVHRQKVVWVHLARTHATVVAIGAGFFAVAVAAEATVLPSDLLVPR